MKKVFILLAIFTSVSMKNITVSAQDIPATKRIEENKVVKDTFEMKIDNVYLAAKEIERQLEENERKKKFYDVLKKQNDISLHKLDTEMTKLLISKNQPSIATEEFLYSLDSVCVRKSFWNHENCVEWKKFVTAIKIKQE